MILDWGGGGWKKGVNKSSRRKPSSQVWVAWNLTVVQVWGAIDNNHYANSARNTATVLTQMVSPSSSV